MIRGPMLLFHANVFVADTRLKHSHFLKVNVLVSEPHNEVRTRSPRRCQEQNKFSPLGQTSCSRQKPNYERFNRNNFNIRYWSWNYRGCWHQTCPPIDSRKAICVLLIPITKRQSLVLVFIVTTSLCQDWVICAPAAFLRCGSRFSGSLSGTEP